MVNAAKHSKIQVKRMKDVFNRPFLLKACNFAFVDFVIHKVWFMFSDCAKRLPQLCFSRVWWERIKFQAAPLFPSVGNGIRLCSNAMRFARYSTWMRSPWFLHLVRFHCYFRKVFPSNLFANTCFHFHANQLLKGWSAFKYVIKGRFPAFSCWPSG